MSDERDMESALLAEIVRRLEENVATERQRARDHGILVHAATQLRLGHTAEVVVAEIKEQNSELLRDYCDIHDTLASAPLRSVTATLRRAWPRTQMAQPQSAVWIADPANRLTGDPTARLEPRFD